jgi:polyribonucleotide nucleotidyltransferase
MQPQQFETEWAGRKLKIEVGRLAQQTNGSCVATYGETSVLATVVKSETVREGIDFMPDTDAGHLEL